MVLGLQHQAGEIVHRTAGSLFDEFFNYPGWQEQEYKAFVEFVDRKNLSYEYLGYCRYSEQVALKITG